MSVTVKVDPNTGLAVGADFDAKLQDKGSWGYLATLLRPLIFLTNDEGSIGQLMNLVQRDHPRLRASGVQEIQKGLNAWRKQPIIGIADLGPVTESEADPDPSDPSALGVTRIWSGAPGTLPSDFDPAQLVPDYELADIYFHGRMWHADAEKVDRYDKASAGQRLLMAKCAEVRTLSAVQWVRYLHDWIVDARAAGWPL